MSCVVRLTPEASFIPQTPSMRSREPKLNASSNLTPGYGSGCYSVLLRPLFIFDEVSLQDRCAISRPPATGQRRGRDGGS